MQSQLKHEATVQLLSSLASAASQPTSLRSAGHADSADDHTKVEAADIGMDAQTLALLPPTVKVFGSRNSRQGKSLEDMLAGMSLDDIVHKNATDCNFFAQFMLGSTYRFPFPPALVAVWNMLIQSLAVLQDYVGESKFALGIPRGFAKTTLMKLFCAYAIIHSKLTFILVVSNVGSNAEKTIKDIADLLGQPHVVDIYGDYSADMDVDRQEEKLFTFAGKKCVLKAKGPRTALRGLNIGNDRPNIILMDDVQDEDNAKSPIESAALKDWLLNTLLPTKSADGGMDIFVGNTYDQKGAILPELVEDPEWTSLVLGAILEDGTSLWERLHPLKKLLSSYRSAVRFGNEGGWLAQYMNIMDVGKNTKYNKQLVIEHYAEFVQKHHLPLDPSADLTDVVQGKYIIIDPSSTKLTADEHSIMLAYLIEGVSMCRKVVHKQMTPKEAITTSVALMLAENCYVAFVEDVAYQDTLIFWFKEHLSKLGLPPAVERMFKILPVAPQRRAKVTRILNMFRQLAIGEVILHPDVEPAATAEAKSFDPLSANNVDNVLDTVHYAPIIAEVHRSVVTSSYEDALFRVKTEEQQRRLDGKTSMKFLMEASPL